ILSNLAWQADFRFEENTMFAKLTVLGLAASLVAGLGIAGRAPHPAISGDYVEIRSCDVYTGPCFANAEMTLGGLCAILALAIRQGACDGVELAGLKAVAVVQARGTLGDVARFPVPTRSVLILDLTATADQRDALAKFVRSKAADVLGETVAVDFAPME